MAEEMTESLRQSAHQDHLLATIVEQSGEAIITIDTHQRVNNWNAAAEKVFGYRFDEIQGNTLEFLEMANVSAAQEGYFSCLTRNGDTIYVLQTCSPLMNDDGECIGEIRMMHLDNQVLGEEFTDEVFEFLPVPDHLGMMSNERLLEQLEQIVVALRA